MNQKKFDLWMNSIDDKYLEEAAAPVKKRSYRSFVMAAAACLVLVATGLLMHQGILSSRLQGDGSSVITTVPSNGEEFAANLSQEVFVKDGIDYTLLSCKAEEPVDISGIDNTGTEPLVWYAGTMELQLCSTKDVAWASWYDTNTGTQWCLTSTTSTLHLLTTAGQLINELGYNVTVAPAEATEITYDAFLINRHTVAETRFLFNKTQYSFRMAATDETGPDFTDISGTGNHYDTHLTSKVGWCPAELYFTENGYGKIIWFDIVPGLLYSVSMETGASEAALLAMAHELFEPAQDNADW